MSHDTLVHRFVRVGVRPLAKTRVTPNHLTALRLLSGLAAAVAYGSGDPGQLWIGSALFVVSFLCDRADGELARLSGKSSRFGHVFDLIADGLATALVFVGIGIGLDGGGLGGWATVLGILAGASVAAIFLQVMLTERHLGSRGGEMRGVLGLDPDDAMLVVPVAMVAGAGDALLIAAGVGAPLALVFMTVALRRRVRARRDAGPA